MGAAGLNGEHDRRDRTSIASGAGEAGAADVHAWEQVEAGRYMPRRIRGSCRGRELG
jgi:hypothetical protein